MDWLNNILDIAERIRELLGSKEPQTMLIFEIIFLKKDETLRIEE